MRKNYAFRLLGLVAATMLTYSSVFAQSGNGYIMTSQEFSSLDFPSHTITSIQSMTHYPVSLDFINGDLIGAFADWTNGDFIGEIDPATGNLNTLGPVNMPGYSINALAEDPTTGIVYAIASQGFSGTTLFIFDMTNLTGTSVGVVSSDLFVSIDFDDTGNLYAINYADGGFYSIDKSTAVPTQIGSLGFPIGGPHVGLGFNPVTSTMYAGLYDNGNMNVCTVDLSTGVATAHTSTTDTDVLAITFPEQTCNAAFTNPGTLCSTESIFDLTPVQAGGTWSGPGITDPTNGTFNPGTAGAGQHDIMYTLACGDVVTETIEVNAVDATTSLAGLTITATASGATYQWLDCDNGYSALAGETSQDFTATTNGNYAVEVTENGCVDTSECVNINSVSLNEIAQNGIKVYPNPSANGAFTMDIQNDLNIEELIVQNLAGQIIHYKSSPKAGILEINLSGEASGVYFLTIKSAVSTMKLKLLKR